MIGKKYIDTIPKTSSIRRSIINGLALNLLTNLLLYIGHLIIARRLPRNDYAVFIVVVNFVSLMALFADLGLTLLFVRKFAEAETLAKSGKNDIRGELLGTMLVFRICMAIVVSIAVTVLAPILGYSLETRHLMFIMLITLFISSRLLVVRSVGEAFLRGHNKYYLVALFTAIDAMVFGAVLYFYSGKILDLEDAIWIYSMCHIPGFILLTGVIYRNIKTIGFKLHFRFLTLATMIRDGLPLVFSTAFLTIHTTADALLLDKLSTPYQVSAYGAGLRVLTAVSFLPAVFSAVIGPVVTQAVMKNELEHIRTIIDRSLRIQLLIAIMIALMLSAAPATVMNILFGAGKYADAASLVTLFSWTFLPIAFATFMTEIAIAEGKLWLSTLYMVIIMVISVISDLIFIPLYGAFGAGIGKGIAVTCGSIVLFFVSNKLVVLDQKKFAIFFFKIIGCIAAALGLLLLLRPIELDEIIKGLLICFTFFALAYITKTISRSEITSFMGIITGKPRL
jgi:O-antigen/teichoic acid export membrane protein